jgi:hypothetical protein
VVQSRLGASAGQQDGWDRQGDVLHGPAPVPPELRRRPSIKPSGLKIQGAAQSCRGMTCDVKRYFPHASVIRSLVHWHPAEDRISFCRFLWHRNHHEIFGMS